MNSEQLTNLHYAYIDRIRHWHPASEPYTGGDALFTAIQEGWEASHELRYEEHWHRGTSGVVIYYFDLRRGDEHLTMPVITNPFIRRLIFQGKFRLVPAGEKRSTRTERRIQK